MNTKHYNKPHNIVYQTYERDDNSDSIKKDTIRIIFEMPTNPSECIQFALKPLEALKLAQELIKQCNNVPDINITILKGHMPISSQEGI